MQKIFFEILVQTAWTVGLIWTILKLTPKSALLSLTTLIQKKILLSNYWDKSASLPVPSGISFPSLGT